MSGYISLHRSIQKHWIYQEDRIFSKFEAWTDILMRVNHTDGKVMHNGTLETVQRGSTIWSMGDMETRWKWSNRKVKRFLDCLVSDQMLSYKSTTKKTYLTVVNYDIYQYPSTTKAPPMHQELTTDAYQKHTNNNDKELNNKKELKDKKSSRFTPPTLDEILSYISEKELMVDGKKFFDYFTVGDWKDSKGNKVKNWKQKLLTWEKHSNGSSKIAQTGQAARSMTLEEFQALEQEKLERSRRERGIT